MSTNRTTDELRELPREAGQLLGASHGFGETTFDSFQKNLFNRPGSWRSTRNVENAPQLLENSGRRPSIGRGSRPPSIGSVPRVPSVSPSENNRQQQTSDMSLDTSDYQQRGTEAETVNVNASTNWPNEGMNAANKNYTAQHSRTLEETLLTLLEENRRRDAMFEMLMRRMDLRETQPIGAQNFQVMPDLTKSIDDFTGNEASTY